jgi:hypothetical protein
LASCRRRPWGFCSGLLFQSRCPRSESLSLYIGPRTVAGPLWVNRVILVVGRLLPVLPWKRTLSGSVAMSEKCQIQTHAPQQKGGSIRSLIGARVRGLIRATPPSEGPQSIASVIVCADPSSRIS